MSRRFLPPDFNSEKELREFYLELKTALYTGATTMLMRQIGPEWALIFKIDCDIAIKKHGSIDRAVAAYGNDAALSQRVRSLKSEMECEVRRAGTDPIKPSKSKRTKRSNSSVMRQRYAGFGKEALDWIEANREALDADDKQTGDAFRDTLLDHAVPMTLVRETGKLTAVYPALPQKTD